jgi:hypothetical protein
MTQIQLLLAQIEIVEAVKPDFMILGFDEDRFPSPPILFFRIDGCSLDDEEPRTESLPVPGMQNPNSPPSTSIFMKSKVRSLT